MDYVYLIGLPEGPIKMGYTRNPTQRIRAIRSKAGAHQELLALYEADDHGRFAESHLHATFSERVVKGEWFSVTLEEAQAFIENNASMLYLRRFDLKNGLPQKSGDKGVPKVLLTLRLPKDLIQRYKSTGKGWATRMAHVIDEAAKDLDV